ncbi:MAG: NAD(P)-dependent oxidoreductase, partial [Anaerolineales bacterium]
LLSRRLYEAVRVDDPQELWGDFAFLGRELRDMTVGIIGVGVIGREIARLARCFGMRVHGVDIRHNPWILPDDRYIPDELRTSPLSDKDPELEIRSPDELDWLLASSDFVILTLPLTPETENLIGEKQLGVMNSSAFLINPARGALVDEAALIKALRENWIAGAALDAFHVEPLPPDSPLYSMPNVFLTPHMSAHTDRLFDRCVDVFCENLQRFLDGRLLLNQVHPPQR